MADNQMNTKATSTTPTAPLVPGHSVVSATDFFPPQLFADGIHSVSISAPVCKLDLFQIVGADEKGDMRKVFQTVVIPTVSLVDFCTMVLNTFNKNTVPMLAAFAEQQRKIYPAQSNNEKDTLGSAVSASKG